MRWSRQHWAGRTAERGNAGNMTMYVFPRGGPRCQWGKESIEYVQSVQLVRCYLCRNSFLALRTFLKLILGASSVKFLPPAFNVARVDNGRPFRHSTAYITPYWTQVFFVSVKQGAIK